uniref:Uncharacterized protein n=1 Tax=Strongyloides venezuelensis TaxID=75913 RepID=A0A0K0FVB6_STRVS
MNFEESLKLITKLRQNYQKEDALDYFKNINISLLPLHNTKFLLIYGHYLSNYAISTSINSTSYLKKKSLWKSIVKLLNDMFDTLDNIENYEEKFNVLLMICNICSFYKEFDDDLLVESCYEYGYMLKNNIENPKNINSYSKERRNELLDYFENIEYTFIMRNYKKDDEDDINMKENNLNNPLITRSKTLSFGGLKEESPLWINGSIDQAIVQKKIHFKKLFRKNTLINIDMFNDPSAPAVQLIKKRVQEVEKDIDNYEKIPDKDGNLNDTYQLDKRSSISNEDIDINKCTHYITCNENDSLFSEDNNNDNSKKSFSFQNFRQKALDDSSGNCSPTEFVGSSQIPLSESFIEELSRNAPSSRRRSKITVSPSIS